jgi:hypothetical protein
MLDDNYELTLLGLQGGDFYGSAYGNIMPPDPRKPDPRKRYFFGGRRRRRTKKRKKTNKQKNANRNMP